MGSLVHLGDDRWRTFIFLGRDRDGRQIRRSKTFRAPDEKRATIAAEKHRTELRALHDAKPLPTETFAAYVDQWLTEAATRLSPTTMHSYRHYARPAKARFGHLAVHDIGTADVRKWYAELLAAGTTPATLAHYHSVLRAIFRQAVADDLIPKPPTFGIRRPTPARHKIKLPPEAKIRAAIDDCPADLLIAAQLGALGLRRGEVMGLRYSDITGRELTIERSAYEVPGDTGTKATKTANSERVIILPYSVLRALARHRARQSDDARRLGHALGKRSERLIVANLDLDPTGQTGYSLGWISHTWRAVCNQHGLPTLRFHDLRHWAASRLFEQHVIPEHVRDQLGHANVTTTLNIYGQILDETASRKARAKLLG